MNTTVIRDNEGNEYTVSKSHKNMTELRERMATAMIKAHGLNITTAEYFRRQEINAWRVSKGLEPLYK